MVAELLVIPDGVTAEITGGTEVVENVRLPDVALPFPVATEITA